MSITTAPSSAKPTLPHDDLLFLLDNAGFLHRTFGSNFHMDFNNNEQITGLGHASNPDNEESKDTNPHNTKGLTLS